MDTHRWLVLAMSAVGLWTSSNGQPGALQCLDCDDVVNPSMCSRSTVCQLTELCFTYKYRHSNITRYRMGCQDSLVCDVVPVRPDIVGRRRTAAHLWKRNNMKVESICFDCCHSNNCNRVMCQRQGVTQTSASTTTSTATTTPSSTVTSTPTTPSTPPRHAHAARFHINFNPISPPDDFYIKYSLSVRLCWLCGQLLQDRLQVVAVGKGQDDMFSDGFTSRVSEQQAGTAVSG
ncbi:uncharacterized protein LOC124279654 [Haliotis rubra]|uniref:uncharacterized protein LOC124279654 n=1 Tax=Haliotis rubra TaxID=36100 RepID=UPI001EE60866|nr:uncharacterized protein LOC124279654 [Haliotis rubra]